MREELEENDVLIESLQEAGKARKRDEEEQKKGRENRRGAGVTRLSCKFVFMALHGLCTFG